MAINLTTPVTGTAQTGFTSPTFTLTPDQAPAANAKQWAVTGLGGTQTGVDVHSISKPFTISFWRAQVLRPLPAANPVTGVIKNIPNNTYKLITRKGAKPSSVSSEVINMIKTEITCAAGTDTYEPEELRAALSLHIGALTQLSAELGNTAVTGVM